MRLDIEVRSSGPGPREPLTALGWKSVGDTGMRWIEEASRAVAERWTRTGLDYKNRQKRLCDGVAIVIRMAG